MKINKCPDCKASEERPKCAQVAILETKLIKIRKEINEILKDIRK